MPLKYKLIICIMMLIALQGQSQNCITTGLTPDNTLVNGTIENVTQSCDKIRNKFFLTFDLKTFYASPNFNQQVSVPVYLVKNTEIIWEGSVLVRSGDTNGIRIEISNNFSWDEADNVRLVLFHDRNCTTGGEIINAKIDCKPLTINQYYNCPKNKMNANFYLEQSKSTGEVIFLNTEPIITTGVEHYWGIAYNGKAPNCNCSCEDIPLSSIKNAQKEGLFATFINSDGQFQNLGIGTNVTSGTSKYGINYKGFPYYGCYKITHYVVCGDNIKSYTTCVGQSPNN